VPASVSAFEPFDKIERTREAVLRGVILCSGVILGKPEPDIDISLGYGWFLQGRFRVAGSRVVRGR